MRESKEFYPLMTNRPTADLFPEKIPDPDENELRWQNRRRRELYAERLGENSTIELRRVTPGDDSVWGKIGELRRRVYVDEHHYLSSDVVDDEGREFDEYDGKEGTVHICAVGKSNDVVGYMRILTKGPDGEDLLPAERAFRVRLDERAIEISRLISDRDFPGGPLVTLALIRAAMHEVTSDPEKYSKAVATLEPFLALHLDNIGIPLKVIADVQETPEYNSSNMLVEMDYASIVERATEMDPVRRFSPVYPEALGSWLADMKKERGLGRIALVDTKERAA